MTVNGTGFGSTSVVRINGINRPTTLVNSTQLTALINATDIQTAGSLTIDVLTPAPVAESPARCLTGRQSGAGDNNA